MSNALRQAARVSARESSGNGSTNPAHDPAAANDEPQMYCVDLEPTLAEVSKEIQSHTVMLLKDKKALVESIIKYQSDLVAKLIEIGHQPCSEELEKHLPSDTKGDRGKNEYLAALLRLLAEHILLPILKDPKHLCSLQDRIKIQLQSLKAAVATARHNAATKRRNDFASKFIKLKPADRDRQYLQNGHLPLDEAKRFCLGCGHCPTVDEPDANEDAMRDNIRGIREHEEKERRDNEAWARGETVLNNRGEPMKKGRSRPFKPKVLYQQCHCDQMGCTTLTGDVPVDECVNRCIDPTTKKRYGFDENGICLCPVCKCRCSLAWDVTAHQLYNDNQRLQNNGGQADTTLPATSTLNQPSSSTSASAAARSRPNPTHTHQFSQSAAAIGGIFSEAWRSAAKSGINTALEDHRRGGMKAVWPLDTGLMNEQAGHFAAVEFSKQFHRDGVHAPYLRDMSKAMGKPTPHTHLRNGSLFNASSIPSSKSNHREINNNLITDNTTADGGKRKKYQQQRRDGPSKKLYPDHFTQPRTASTNDDDDEVTILEPGSKQPPRARMPLAAAAPAAKRGGPVLDLTDSNNGKMPASRSQVYNGNDDDVEAAANDLFDLSNSDDFMASITSQLQDYSPPVPHGRSYAEATAAKASLPASFANIPTPITATVQNNPMEGFGTGGTVDVFEGANDPRVVYYNRMVTRSSQEEGVIDVDNGSATNEMARRRTANLIDNPTRVETFIEIEMGASSAPLTSPKLLKKYDYYWAKEYASSP